MDGGHRTQDTTMLSGLHRSTLEAERGKRELEGMCQIPGSQCRNIIVLVLVVTFRTFLPAVTEFRSYAGSH